MNIFLLLLLIPVLTLLSGLILYSHNGKKEILKFDLVQFIYSFVMTPLFFIWIKSFIFYLLKQEAEIKLTITETFVIDTAFSVLFLYIYAFVVIHSLTKSFSIKRFRDPLYDIFKHSEYFHLWLSHLVLYFGGMVIFTVLSFVNVFIPLDIPHNKSQLYLMFLIGLLGGGAAFKAIWNYQSPDPNFYRLMKLSFALFFTIHVVLYFAFDISLELRYVAYWFVFMAFTATVLYSVFSDVPERANSIFNKIKWKIGLK